MSASELSKEQLLEYAQKLTNKMKKLEADINSTRDKLPVGNHLLEASKNSVDEATGAILLNGDMTKPQLMEFLKKHRPRLKKMEDMVASLKEELKKIGAESIHSQSSALPQEVIAPSKHVATNDIDQDSKASNVAEVTALRSEIQQLQVLLEDKNIQLLKESKRVETLEAQIVSEQRNFESDCAMLRSQIAAHEQREKILEEKLLLSEKLVTANEEQHAAVIAELRRDYSERRNEELALCDSRVASLRRELDAAKTEISNCIQHPFLGDCQVQANSTAAVAGSNDGSATDSLPEQLMLLRKQIHQLSEVKNQIQKVMSQRGEVERRQQEEVHTLRGQLHAVEAQLSLQTERDSLELAALKAQLQAQASQQVESDGQEVAALKAELQAMGLRQERDAQELVALRLQLLAVAAELQTDSNAQQEVALLKAQLLEAETRNGDEVTAMREQLGIAEAKAAQMNSLEQTLTAQLLAAETQASQETARHEEDAAARRSPLHSADVAAPPGEQELAAMSAQLLAVESRAAKQAELQQQEVTALRAQLAAAETHASRQWQPESTKEEKEEVAALRAQLRDLQEQVDNAASAVDRSRMEEVASQDGTDLNEARLLMQLELLAHLLRSVSVEVLQLPPKTEIVASPENHYEMDHLFHDKAEEKIPFGVFADSEQSDDRRTLDIVVDCNSDPSSTVAAAEILLSRLLEAISNMKVSIVQEQGKVDGDLPPTYSAQPSATDSILTALSERASALIQDDEEGSAVEEAKHLAAAIDVILRLLNDFLTAPDDSSPAAAAVAAVRADDPTPTAPALELELQQLSNQLQAVQTERDELVTEIERLQREKTEAASLRESLEKQLIDSVATVADLSQEKEAKLEASTSPAMDDLKSELLSMKARLEGAESDCDSYRLRTAALESERNAAEQSEAALKDELVHVRAHIETLRGDLDAAKESTAAAVKAAADSEDKLQHQVTSLASLTAESAAMRAQCAQHEADMFQLQAAKKNLESLLEVAESEASTASLLRNRLEEERLLDEKKIETLLAEKEAMILELSMVKVNLTSERSVLQSSVDQLRQELTSAVDREHRWKEEVGLQSAQLDALKLKFEEEKGAVGSQLLSENTALSSEIADFRRKFESLQVESVAEKTRLESTCADLQSQLKSAVEQSSLQEATNKKLMTKLKAKMKELSDLTCEKAQGVCDREDAFKSEKDNLERSIVELQGELETASRQLSKRDMLLKELEVKLKQCTEREIASEERISSLLREKNKLQEDAFQQSNRIDCMARETEQLRAQLSISEQSLRDATSAKDRLVEEDARNRAQHTLSLNSMLGEMDKAKQQLLQQQQLLREDSKRHAAELQSATQQSAAELAAAQAKIESLNEKVKSLKVLLQKLNNKAQEKESKVSELMLLNERPKRFRIIARLSVLSPKQQLEELSDESSAPSEMLPWCLIFEDSSAGGTSSRSPVRWIEESQVQQWRKEGSSVVGSIPQPLQETWEYSLSSLRSELDQQREDLTSRLDEVNAAYQAYKIRAQSALKRIGNEERNEKQRAHEQELAQEVERLKAAMKELESESLSLREECLALQEALRSSDCEKASAVEQLRQEKDTLTSLQSSQLEVERRLREVTHEMELLRMEKLSMEDLLQESADKHTALLQQYNIITFDGDTRSPSRSRGGHGREHHLVKSDDATPTQSLSPPVEGDGDGDDEGRPISVRVATATVLQVEMAEVVHTVAETVRNDAPAKPSPRETVKGSTAAPESSSSSSSSMALDLKQPPRQAGGKPSPRIATSGIDSVNGGGKMLLHHQADSNLKESLVVLRKENSALMMEMIELRNDISLRDEQANALKSTIRELESSILREREFNAASRRINADYLVNILRNFLMSGNPSERAKLVPVLCTILHLQPDETKLINEKWMVRTGGLVGWLLPTRPLVSSSSAAAESNQRDDGQMDMMMMTAPGQGASMARGGTNSKRAGMRGDLSYDPVTGSSVGVGGMDIYA